MREDPKVTKRRNREHTAGRHGECRPDGRCQVARELAHRERPDPRPPNVTDEVENYAASYPFGNCGRCKTLMVSARLLAREMDYGNRSLAGELRQTLGAIGACKATDHSVFEANPLDELLARRNRPTPAAPFTPRGVWPSAN